MFPELAFVVVGFAAIAALNSWRAGLVLCTVIAILQDPMRKLTPGQPVYFVVLVGAVFGAAWLGAYGSRVPLRPGFVVGWREQVGGPFSLLVFVIVGQAIHSLTRFGSVPMTAIGLLSYLSPIPAVVFAYQYALRSGLSAVTRWMWTYVALASIALASVYVEYLGVDWPGLGQVGEGLIIYDVGRALKAYAGFFRAAEVAAWHTACVSCFAVILMFGKRRSLMGLILALGLTVFLASIGALTGRRKLLVQVAVFLSVYGGLFLLYQRHARKLAGVVAVAGLACYFAIVAGVDPDPGERVYDSHKLTVGEDELYSAYLLRARSVVEDLGDRASGLGLQPLMWAYDQWGFWGAGVGTGSQGAYYFGAWDLVNGGAAEGGVGKVALELGFPGLSVVAWFAYALVRYLGRILDYLTARSPAHARFAYGLVAFLAANVATFFVATQVYGDVFILLILGWSLGFLLSLPVLVNHVPRPARSLAGFDRRHRQPIPCARSTAG